MEIYEEYVVKTTATQKEKVTAIALILVAFLGIAGSFLWWPLLIVGLVSGGIAIWYWPRLQYEFEYQVYRNEIDIDKVIAKKDRKSCANIDLTKMEVFTNDFSQIRAFTQGGKATLWDYAGNPGQGQKIWILVRQGGQPDLYELSATPEMIADLRKCWPQKAKIVPHPAASKS